MVKNATSLTGNGLRDWFIQRVTSIIITVYTVFVAFFLATHAGLTYLQWHDLFAHPLMKIVTMLTLLSLVGHGWIGLWTVTTDYIKHTATRISVQLLVILVLLSSLFWGIYILWGIV